MSKQRKIFIIVGLFFVLILSELYIFNRQVSFSRGRGNLEQSFEIAEGEGVKEIGKKLEESGIIENDLYFNYYIWKTGSRGKLQAGRYELRGSMTIPEIVQLFSLGEVVLNEVKVTFPEGLNAKSMEEILTKKGLDGEGFLNIAQSDATNLSGDFGFLKDLPPGATLEGFLFPDTYIFFRDASADEIVERMLLNFDEKYNQKMKDDAKSQKRTVFETVTMASLLEKEVRTFEDMKIVSGLFWDRIAAGQPLQSCATIAFALGKEKKQYSFEDTRTPSPYNTYLYQGLPPGPIANPGKNALMAAIYPIETEYNYFLSDPETGQTIFSETIEEHAENKAKYGL